MAWMRLAPRLTILCCILAPVLMLEEVRGASLPSSTSDIIRAAEGEPRLSPGLVPAPSPLSLDSSWQEIARHSVQILPPDSSASRAYQGIERDLDILRHRLQTQSREAQDPTFGLIILRRRATLTKIREEVYKRLNMKHMPKGDNLVVPYRDHLAPGEFGWYVVRALQSPSRTPWLWVFENKRYLVTHEYVGSAEFVKANNFKPRKDGRKYFGAFVEVGESGSEVFEYLGVFPIPRRIKSVEAREQFFGPLHYHVEAFRVLSGSTFSTKTG